MSLPTPKTLDEAIDQALMVGPLFEIRERAHMVLKDFIAQKFSIAYLKIDRLEDEVSSQIIRQLFKDLTTREQGGSMILETLEAEKKRCEEAIEKLQVELEASDSNDAHSGATKALIASLTNDLEQIKRNIERFK